MHRNSRTKETQAFFKRAAALKWLWAFGAALGTSAIFLLSLHRGSIPPDDPDVTVYAARLPCGNVFIEEDPRNPELHQLLVQEHLDRLVAQDRSDIDLLSTLVQWARKAFPTGELDSRFLPWNARIILDESRINNKAVLCGRYGIVFGQACQSLGYPVRYVDLGSPNNVGGHFVVSVYLPLIHDWAVYDPTRGVYYGYSDGKPLNLFALHRYAVGASARPIYQFPGHQRASSRELSLYYSFRYYLRNNFLTVPVFATQRGNQILFETDRLAWRDPYTAREAPFAQHSFWSSDPHDFIFRFDLKACRRELRCLSTADFQRQLAQEPVLQVCRVRVPLSALTQAIRQNIGSPPTTQLAAFSAARDDRSYPVRIPQPLPPHVAKPTRLPYPKS